jgi:superfamily II DNA/RNA helicase
MPNKPRYTIIDEADEMVQADWTEDMRQIFGGGRLS